MKAIIFEENRYGGFFRSDSPHMHRAIADVDEGKFHVCNECKDFIFKGIVIPKVNNLAIELWSDFASRHLGTYDFTVDVFGEYDPAVLRTCRIIGETEIPDSERLIRRARQFDRINGFWNSHKSRVGNSLRKALFEEVRELLDKAQSRPAFQPS